MRLDPRHLLTSTLSAAMLTTGCLREPVPEHAASSVPGESAGHQTAAPLVTSPSESQVKVSQHNVGPIPLDSSLGYLAKRFRYERSTGQLEETQIPAWVFYVAGVTAVAEQVAANMDLSKPADTWLISGRGIVLPGGVPLSDTWGGFRAHYHGEASLRIDELGAHVLACDMPGLTLYLLFDYASMDWDTLTAASIPASARMEQIGVYPLERTQACP